MGSQVPGGCGGKTGGCQEGRLQGHQADALQGTTGRRSLPALHYLIEGRTEAFWERRVVLVALDGAVISAEESALDSGKGITSIEIRKTAPLIAATASWATGLTGSIGSASLSLKTSP